MSCYRRFIIYPLCRSLVLAETVRKDVAEILKLGKSYDKNQFKCNLAVITKINFFFRSYTSYQVLIRDKRFI